MTSTSNQIRIKSKSIHSSRPLYKEQLKVDVRLGGASGREVVLDQVLDLLHVFLGEVDAGVWSGIKSVGGLREA